MTRRLPHAAAGRVVITLGDVADRTDWLVLDCRHCPRRGRLSTARLVERHGREANMVDLRLVLAGGCPRLTDGPPSMPNRCGIGCPEIGELFRRFP